MGETVDPRPSGGDGDGDLPIGTQVVTCADILDRSGAVVCPGGAVGVIVALPGAELQPYRVRLPDGRIIHAHRQDLAVGKEVQRQGLLIAGAHVTSLYRYVIYRCVVGSRAYGLATADSDTDRRGFYLPPAALQWSLAGVPEQLENRETEESYHRREYERLRAELQGAFERSSLPDAPSTRTALHDLLVRLRLDGEAR